MGTIYAMNCTAATVIDELRNNEIPDLKLVHKPLTDNGSVSLWPFGVQDFKGNVAWFEDPDYLLVWGANDITSIVRRFKDVGIELYYQG